MRLVRWGRCAPFLLAVVAALGLVVATPAPAGAACDAGATCGFIYSSLPSTFADSWGGATEYGSAFTVDETVELQTLRWYRHSGSYTRPLGFRLWEDGVIVPGWSGAGSAYTDIIDSGTGPVWQETLLSGSNRRILTPGHTYVLSVNTAAGGSYVYGLTPPSPSHASINYIADRTAAAGSLPSGGPARFYMVDGSFAMLGNATATPTFTPPSPTLTPAATFTPTLVPPTPTPVPVFTIDNRPELRGIGTAVAGSGNQNATAVAGAAQMQATSAAQVSSEQATAVSNASQAATAASNGIQAGIDAVGSTLGAWLQSIGGSIGGLAVTVGERIAGAIEVASMAGVAAQEAASAAATAASTAADEAFAAGVATIDARLEGIRLAVSSVQYGVVLAIDALMVSIGNRLGDIADAVEGAPGAFVDAVTDAFVVSPGFLEAEGDLIQAAWEERLPIGEQVGVVQAGLADFLSSASPGCVTGGPGLSLSVRLWGATGSLPALDGSFMGWYCPWRPAIGAVVVIISGLAAARSLFYMVELHR